MKRCHTACLLYCVVLVSVPLLTTASWATTVLRQSFPDLVQKADTIAVGTVSAIAAEWDATTQRPYTLVTFTDLDVRKGAAQDTLTLRFLGGPDPDGNILTISGVPQFHLGDRMVLFVVGNNHQAIPLVGLWQGLYRVVFDPDRDEEIMYTHDMRPLATLPQQQGGVVYDHMAHPLGDAPVTAPLALDDVLQAIKECSMIKLFLVLFLLFGAGLADSHAFVRSTSGNGVPAYWRQAEAPLNILVGCPGSVTSCFERAARSAAEEWNAAGAQFTFRFGAPTPGIPVACAEQPVNINGLVTLFWSSQQTVPHPWDSTSLPSRTSGRPETDTSGMPMWSSTISTFGGRLRWAIPTRL